MFLTLLVQRPQRICVEGLVLAMLKASVIGAVLTIPLWAGQSLRLSGNQTVSNTSVAAQPANGACRLEFQLVFPSAPASPNLGGVDACGLFIQYSGTNLL